MPDHEVHRGHAGPFVVASGSIKPFTPLQRGRQSSQRGRQRPAACRRIPGSLPQIFGSLPAAAGKLPGCQNVAYPNLGNLGKMENVKHESSRSTRQHTERGTHARQGEHDRPMISGSGLDGVRITVRRPTSRAGQNSAALSPQREAARRGSLTMEELTERRPLPNPSKCGASSTIVLNSPLR